MINIIGLGVTNRDGLTLEAMRYLKDEHPNYVRTKKVKCIEELESEIEYESFDEIYETEESFENVYEKIVEILLEKSKERDINYFVPGTPLIAEKTVLKLLERTENVKLVSGVSFIEHVLNAVKKDPSKGFMLLDADDFNYFDINPKLDIMITQVYNMRTAVDLKLQLAEIYTDEYEVYFVRDAGLNTEVVEKIKICDMDRKDYNHQCVIYVPKSEIPSMSSILEEIKKKSKLKNVDLDELVDSLKRDLESLISLDLSGEYYLYDVLSEIYNKSL